MRLSPDVFQLRNVVPPACYRSTKSPVFVHIRPDRIPSLPSSSLGALHPHSLSVGAQLSRAALCCTVHRNTELQADHKLLHQKIKKHLTDFQQSRSGGGGEGGWRKGREEEEKESKTSTGPCSFPVSADLRDEERQEEKTATEEERKERLDNDKALLIKAEGSTRGGGGMKTTAGEKAAKQVLGC